MSFAYTTSKGSLPLVHLSAKCLWATGEGSLLPRMVSHGKVFKKGVTKPSNSVVENGFEGRWKEAETKAGKPFMRLPQKSKGLN